MAVIPTVIEGLLQRGASASVDGASTIPIALENFARLAKARGGHLTIRNCGSQIPIALDGIAGIGGAHVTFEF
jgi:hypothetical protein